VHSFRNRAQARVQEHYTWDQVVDQYEQLFASMAGFTLPGDPLQSPLPAEARAAALTKSASA